MSWPFRTQSIRLPGNNRARSRPELEQLEDRLTPSGVDLAWTRQFGAAGNDVAAGVAVATDGVYVAGRVSGDLAGTSAGEEDGYLRKYNAAGATLWTRQFGTAGNDNVKGVAVAADGIYVAGVTTGSLGGTSAGNEDGFVRKYNAAGTVLWTRQVGTAGTDIIAGVAVAAGGVYVAGYTNGAIEGTNAGDYDGFVRKYNAAGTVLWTRQFGTASYDYAQGVAAAADGVYVAGSTGGALQGTNAGGSDGFVRKYDTAGNVLWINQLGTAGDDAATSVAVAVDGVYVAAYIGGALDGTSSASPGSTDALVRKYDADGNVLWTRQFGTASYDNAYGVAATADGVYVTGSTGGTLQGANAGGTDAFVRKYDAAGTALWTRQLGGTGNDFAAAVAMAADGVYIAGYTTGALQGTSAGDYDAFVAKYRRGPTLDGTTALTRIDDKHTARPFAAVTIGDPDAPAQTLTVTVVLDRATKGTLTNLLGFVPDVAGTYTFLGTAAAATRTLRGLVFRPTANRVAPNATEDTKFTITVTDGSAPLVRDSATVVRVTSVNDAPVLPAASPKLTPVKKNAINPASNRVSLLLLGATDVDFGASKGIAVFAAAGNGTWQYSSDGGTTWKSLGTVSTTAARLLKDSWKVRFKPAAGSTGTATLTYRAWDQTTGTAGGTASMAARGGTTAFSSGARKASLAVVG